MLMQLKKMSILEMKNMKLYLKKISIRAGKIAAILFCVIYYTLGIEL